MKPIWTIAALTVKEAIRDKILYLLFSFAALLILSSVLMGKLTVGDDAKIIKDVGMAAIHFFGIMIGIFIGVGLIFRDMEKRTIYLILSKPVERHEFLIGKFLGLALTLLMVMMTLMVLFEVVVALRRPGSPLMLQAFYLGYLEWLFVAGIGLLFSTFSTPLLSSMLTLACFLAGHLTESFHLLQARLHSPISGAILSAMFYVVPNLELFNVRLKMVHEIAVPAGYLISTTIYWFVYLSAILLLSIRIFQKKDFV